MNNTHQLWSRRKFVTSVSAGGTAIMFRPWLSWAADQKNPQIAEIVAKTIGIDTHNHIDVPLESAELPGPKLDLASELQKSGLTAIVMTFATDYKRNVRPGEAYERFVNGLTAMDTVIEANNLKRALTLTDIKSAHKKQHPTVVQSVEGCHFLEGKLEHLEVAYKRGVRHLGLLHDSDASVPLGDVYTNPVQWGGLTVFGAEVIEECNRLGIFIDLAHGSDGMINSALKKTKKPIMISHTGLDTQLGKNAMMAKMMQPRLISKDQAKLVADAGGIIGVWTHLADTPLEYAQNIRALVEVIGVDHVCIGTDTKLTAPYRSSKDFGAQPRQEPPGFNPDLKPDSFKQNQKPPNLPNNAKRAGERTNETWNGQKEGFYYAVVAAMIETGFNENEISKIGGDNFCRLFDKATTGH